MESRHYAHFEDLNDIKYGTIDRCAAPASRSRISKNQVTPPSRDRRLEAVEGLVEKIEAVICMKLNV